MQNGILLIDKEEGLTSRAIDNCLMHLYKTKKVGHLGTLDPFASGLLVIAINKATKALPYIDDSYKIYVASLKLGVKTVSGDKDGEITAKKEVPLLSKEQVQDTLDSFLGESTQIPPLYSAIKVDGEALYKKARKGENIERKPRQICVKSISLLSFSGDSLSFLCEVSKGTYVRSLGEDIAFKLGTYGYLTSLRRLSVGEMLLKDALKIEDIKEDTPLINVSKLIAYRHLEVSDPSDAYNGRKIFLPYNDEKILITYKEEAIAIYRHEEGNVYHMERGLF